MSRYHCVISNSVSVYPLKKNQLSRFLFKCAQRALCWGKYHPTECNLLGFVLNFLPQHDFVWHQPPAFLSFRAAQKLNLSSKRKKHQPSLLHPQEPSIYPTNFSGILQVSPPPAPPCLLRAVSKVKENPGMGKVREGTGQLISVIHMDCPYKPTWPFTHLHTQTDPYLKGGGGGAQSGSTVAQRQHIFCYSPQRWSQIISLECYEFVWFMWPASSVWSQNKVKNSTSLVIPISFKGSHV